MSFVEDNSLGNVLRYARMMHRDFPGSGLGPTRTHTTHCHYWAVVRRRYRQLLTCLGVISKHITQGWGRLNFNGLIFGQVGNRSLSDKPNGPDRHLCQLRGLKISWSLWWQAPWHRGVSVTTWDMGPGHWWPIASVNTPHVLFQAWTSLNDSRCQGQGRPSIPQLTI